MYDGKNIKQHIINFAIICTIVAWAFFLIDALRNPSDYKNIGIAMRFLIWFIDLVKKIVTLILF
jgi:ylmG protein